MDSTGTQSIAISEPIREKYVQIFSLQRNISEMSVKTIWEKPMRKDFFTPPREEREWGRRGKGGRRVKRKIERKEKLLWTEGRGEEEGMAMAREREKRVGALLTLSEMLTHSHAGLSGQFPFPSYCWPKEPQRTQSVSFPHPALCCSGSNSTRCQKFSIDCRTASI